MRIKNASNTSIKRVQLRNMKTKKLWFEGDRFS